MPEALTPTIARCCCCFPPLAASSCTAAESTWAVGGGDDSQSLCPEPAGSATVTFTPYRAPKASPLTTTTTTTPTHTHHPAPEGSADSGAQALRSSGSISQADCTRSG